MLHKNIEASPSPLGARGLRATGFIGAGEVTWRAEPEWDGGGTRYSIQEISSWPEKRQAEFYVHSYQASDTEWIGGNEEDDISLLMNHSCDPNTWFVSDTEMVARRDILLGEEITYDYATSQTTDTEFECRCGSTLCRHSVTGQEYKEPWFFERYKGHILKYIEEKVLALQRNKQRQPTRIARG